VAAVLLGLLNLLVSALMRREGGGL